MSSKQNIGSESLITPALAAKMKVFFEGIDPSAQVKYKHLFSSLQQDNQKKAQKLHSLTSKLESFSRPQSMNTSRNKFSRINSQPSLLERSTKTSLLNSFQQSFLGQKMVSQSLQQQHVEYESSLLKLKKSIKDMNIQINQIKLKQPLYNKLETISRFQKISSMYTVGRAESQLKKIMKQKQDLTVLQIDFDRKKQTTRAQDISLRNTLQDKISKLRLKKISTRQQLTRLCNGLIISQDQSDIISIVDCFHKLLELFAEKESDFQNLKLETCVKAGKQLKIYSGMSDQKIHQINKINSFEQQSKIKLTSMFNLIQSIYTKLKVLQEDLNFKYKQLVIIKDDRVSDLQYIEQKQNFSYDTEIKVVRKSYNGKRLSRDQSEIDGRMEFMSIRSRFWIQFTQFWRTLLIKMTNTQRLYQNNKGLVDQIEVYFSKYGYHENTQSQTQNQIISQAISAHFQGNLTKSTMIQALNTFMCDWRTSFYLKKQIVQQQIGRLSPNLPPEQKLYTLLQLLVNESNQCFSVYLNHSVKIFTSCYHALNSRKNLSLIKKTFKINKNELNIQGKQQIVSIPSDNSVKSQILITRNWQAQNQKPKQYGQRVLTELLKMAAVPIGQLFDHKGSKKGCFY